MKAEIDKLETNKLSNLTLFTNLKTKVDDLDVGELKAVLVDLKKICDLVDNEVVENTKFNTLKSKVSNLEKKIPDAVTLIHIGSIHILHNHRSERGSLICFCMTMGEESWPDVYISK